MKFILNIKNTCECYAKFGRCVSNPSWGFVLCICVCHSVTILFIIYLPCYFCHIWIIWYDSYHDKVKNWDQESWFRSSDSGIGIQFFCKRFSEGVHVCPRQCKNESGGSLFGSYEIRVWYHFKGFWKLFNPSYSDSS